MSSKTPVHNFRNRITNVPKSVLISIFCSTVNKDSFTTTRGPVAPGPKEGKHSGGLCWKGESFPHNNSCTYEEDDVSLLRQNEWQGEQQHSMRLLAYTHGKRAESCPRSMSADLLSEGSKVTWLRRPFLHQRRLVFVPQPVTRCL